VWSSIENLFKIPELKRRILYTLGMLAVYRIGFAVPIPGVNLAEFVKRTSPAQGGFLDFIKHT
jgi:preprotein translocase subunit SecY